MNENDILRDTLDVWCPNYPRRVSGLAETKRGWGQKSVNNEIEAIKHLKSVKYKHPGFVSVYSFPRGHTSDEGDEIPHIDTLMFDFDFEGSADDPTEKWARDMSALLTRTRMVAKALLDMDKAKYWRASLSGHKGIHLYLDFPALNIQKGDADQFRNGIRQYTEDVVAALLEETGLESLESYLDVSSGKDFARLTRLPNTVHEGATKRFGELRYCVPVTIEELAQIEPKDYVALTKRQRPIREEMERVENEKVGELLSKQITLASSSPSSSSTTATYNPRRIEQYRENSNEAIDLEKLEFLLKRKPCIWAFRESEEMFSNGQESHMMELNVIAAMVDLNTPIETIVEFFNVNEDFDKEYTEEKVKELIAYNYSSFDCSTILEKAESYCLKEKCNIYNRSDDLKRISS